MIFSKKGLRRMAPHTRSLATLSNDAYWLHVKLSHQVVKLQTLEAQAHILAAEAKTCPQKVYHPAANHPL